MVLSTKECGAVILAGGQSRRMGQCKALLLWEGETMLARLSRQLSFFDEIFLSANDPKLGDGLPLQTVADRYPGAGPLAGLHSALSATDKQALLCVPCDLPYFSAALAEMLLNRFPDGAEAFVCRDSERRVHPLCGIYTAAALPCITEQLELGEHRVMDLFKHLKCAFLDTAPYFSDRIFFNMNTVHAYRLLTDHGDIPQG